MTGPALIDPLVFDGSKGWTITRHLGIEVFTSPSGTEYVRATKGETPDAIIRPKTRGLSEVQLRLAADSATVKRADRKDRKQKRELRERGYDV